MDAKTPSRALWTPLGLHNAAIPEEAVRSTGSLELPLNVKLDAAVVNGSLYNVI
jgi:hypothetical protein